MRPKPSCLHQPNAVGGLSFGLQCRVGVDPHLWGPVVQQDLNSLWTLGIQTNSTQCCNSEAPNAFFKFFLEWGTTGYPGPKESLKSLEAFWRNSLSPVVHDRRHQWILSQYLLVFPLPLRAAAHVCLQMVMRFWTEEKVAQNKQLNFQEPSGNKT